MNIRLAVPADEPRIRELFRTMLQTIYHTEDVEDYEEGYLNKFWSGGEDRIYIAADDGAKEAAAFLSVEVHREEREYVYYDDFSVAEGYRNRGFGTALIRAAEAYAKELGVPAALLHVEKSNTAAMRFYERLGYSVYRDDGSRYMLKKDFPAGGPQS